ncbi:MAG: hypothetical protein AVDCRST_MAG88-4501, partial [uncultured Thermomicrobiales bacterium]
MQQRLRLPRPSSATAAPAGRAGLARIPLRTLVLALGALLALVLLLAPTLAGAAGASPAIIGAAADTGCQIGGTGDPKGPHASPEDDGDLVLDPAQEASERQRLKDQGRRLPKGKQEPRADAVGLFGYVVSAGVDCLVIDTYEPVKGGKGVKVLEKESLPGLGLTSTRLQVTVKPKAVIEVPGGLAGLEAGAPVLVGGALAGDKLMANVVADLRLAKPVQAEPGQAGGTTASVTSPQALVAQGWSSAATMTAGTGDAGAEGDATVSALATAQRGPTTLDFKGGFGGPTFEYVANPNVTIFDIGVVRVKFAEFRFIAALAGWSYDFPFAFSAEAPTL